MRSALLRVLGFLTVLLGTATLLWGNSASFEGEMRVAVHSYGNIAIRPSTRSVAEEPVADSSGMVALPGADLPLDSEAGARSWIDPNSYYDVISLPFAVTVDYAKELQSRAILGRIEVQDGGTAATYVAENGSSISAGSISATVLAIQPWSGLVPVSGNPPMVAFAVTSESNAAPRDFLLPAGAWSRVDDETGVYFAWVTTESDAHLLLEEGRDEAPSARWGAIDGGDSSWLRTFEPGSGLVLSDGTSITLIQREGARPEEGRLAPCIEVEIAGKDGASRRQIPANTVLPDVPVRYEDVSLLPRTLRLVSWEKNAALIQVSRHDAEPLVRKLGEGEQVELDPGGLSIRLDAALPEAVAVLPGSTALLEATVAFPGRTLRLVEDRPVTLNGAALTFSVEAEPARVTYDLTLTEADGSTQTLSLGPDDSFRSGTWLVRQKPSRATSAELAGLAVVYAPAIYATRAGIACITLAFGILAFSLARRVLRAGAEHHTPP